MKTNSYSVEYTEEEAQRKAAEEEMRKQSEFWSLSYPDRVSKLIREEYSLDDEFALNRQRDTKQEEFAAYFAYCEECKERAKAEVI